MSPDPARLASRLKEIAGEEGFELAGICRPGPSEHGAFLESWLEGDLHGEMGYLARPDAVARRKDLALTLPEVRSVLVVAHGYDQPDPEGVPEDPCRGVIARYARGRDYHRVVKKGLGRVHRRFQTEAGAEVPARAYVDTGPILERELARRAGIGWFGRNTMVLNPRTGSYFFLGVLLLGIDLGHDEPFEADHCGSCRACLDACPTGALLGRDENGAPVMDARRCISYLTIEHRGPIPRELRPLMGNRVYGCDICQEVCPFNVKFSETAAEPGYAARGPGERPGGVEPLPGEEAATEPHPGTEAPPLARMMRMTREEWDVWTRGSAIRRAGYAGFKRNVAVAMGNWLAGVEEPPEEAVAALQDALDDAEPLVREHAAWALER
jgi:epoxyqueuosine reductase